MDSYTPPFEITNAILLSVSSISEKLGRMDVIRSLDTKPHLRKINRIKSVHASLKIEANSLSEGSVRDVLNNRTVIGPEKEIREVKNAFAAYDEIGRADPYSLEDLKRLHGIMTHMTVEESGVFRRGNEGVFDGDHCIFMAPPPEMVPSLMSDLFAWMKRNAGTVHPLILSCVFHYEFVFIHPFCDGNGRMARLWQTILLTAWNPLFQYIPLESRIERFQEDYYRAISVCNANGNSTAFIEFMLLRIDEVLADSLSQSSVDGAASPYIQKLLDVMEYDTPYAVSELLSRLHLKSTNSLRLHYLQPAMEAGLIEMTVPDKPTSRNQRYIKK